MDKVAFGGRVKMPTVTPHTIRRAIMAHWLERLFTTESRAAAGHARKHEDNGQQEALRLHRLARAWRARALVMLDVDIDSRQEQDLAKAALHRWFS